MKKLWIVCAVIVPAAAAAPCCFSTVMRKPERCAAEPAGQSRKNF